LAIRVSTAYRHKSQALQRDLKNALAARAVLKTMYFLYSILLSIWLAMMAPVLWYRAKFKGKELPGLGERLGQLPDALAHDGRVTLWLHACSVGEALSLQPLIDELVVRYPNARLVISTITNGGQKVAREKYGKIVGDGVFYFPVDEPPVVRHVFDKIKPAMLIVVDTEIWPNVLREASHRDIPVLLVNGRISAKSFRTYQHLRPFLAPVLANYKMLLMKDQVDVDRIVRMGAQPSRVRLTGNMKYDVSTKTITADQRDALDAALGVTSSPGPVIVAGSTHEGEEAALFAALKTIRSTDGLEATRILLAPRHIERANAVAALAIEHGFTLTRRTVVPPKMGADILLLDTLGELATAYQFADVAFVGGTLVPVGGHSIMEPALFGKAIVVGPRMQNFGNMADEFVEAGAMAQTERDAAVPGCADELAATITALLADPPRRATMGAAARDLFERSQGATKLTADAISEVLGRLGK
jgi:3-deoxy-D-manno-octulosonic-acid transferase